MVQVDLAVLVALFYMLGEKHQYPQGDVAVLYNSLDTWQKNELNNSFVKGKADAGHS